MDSENTEDSRCSAEDKEVDDEEIGTPIGCLTCGKDACKMCWCGFNNYWKALIGLSVVTVYLLLGGLFFNALERPNEIRQIEDAQAERQAAFAAFNETAANFTEMIVSLTNLTEEAANNLTSTLIAVATRVAEASETLPAESNPIWDYASAVFFASTVITTIGYGTIAPATAGGQVLFIFYAILGIPIALIFLSVIGSILSDWLDAALQPLVKRFGKGSVTAKAIGAIAASLFALIFFIFIPSGLFFVVERSNDWTYLNSIYYCFVTLTTVGFGDFVPGIAGSTISDNPAIVGLYKIIVDVWLWIGLAILATLISEVQGLLEASGMAIHKWRMSRRKKREKFIVDRLTNQELTSVTDKGGMKTSPPTENANTDTSEGGEESEEVTRTEEERSPVPLVDNEQGEDL